MTIQKYFIYLPRWKTYIRGKKNQICFKKAFFSVKFFRVSLFRELKNCDRLNRDFQDCSFFCLSMMAPLSCCLKEANWQKSAFCTTALLQLFFYFFKLFTAFFGFFWTFPTWSARPNSYVKMWKARNFFIGSPNNVSNIPDGWI